MKKRLGLVSSVLLVGSLIGGQSISAFELDFPMKNSSGINVNALIEDEGYVYEEEPNDSFDLANLIYLDELIIGELTLDDVDYYEVTIEDDEPVLFFLGAGPETEESEMDIFVELFDENKEVVAPEEIYDEYGQFGLGAELEPGTYYLAVEDLNNADTGEEYFLFTTAFLNDPVVSRMSGQDRYETAVEIAKMGWGPEETPHIILTTGSDFPDALAGSPLAYLYGAPILLTKKDSIPASVAEAIDYFGVESVTIIGGTQAVSEKVEKDLKKKYGLDTERIAGQDRYETAAMIASQLPGSDTAYVTNGQNYPDALSIAPYAAYNMSPILLTRKDSLPTVTKNAVKNYNDTYAIGGTAVISNAVLEKLPNSKRIKGKNRYETSVQVVRQLKMNTDFVNLATGENFADALTGSVLAAMYGEPVLLTKKHSLDPSTKKLFTDKQTMYFNIFGGTNAVSTDVEDEIYSLFE